MSTLLSVPIKSVWLHIRTVRTLFHACPPIPDIIILFDSAAVIPDSGFSCDLYAKTSAENSSYDERLRLVCRHINNRPRASPSAHG